MKFNTKSKQRNCAVVGRQSERQDKEIKTQIYVNSERFLMEKTQFK